MNPLLACFFSRVVREHLGEKEVQLSLTFDAVEDGDLANYTCYVENHIGRRSGSAILQKKGRAFHFSSLLIYWFLFNLLGKKEIDIYWPLVSLRMTNDHMCMLVHSLSKQKCVIYTICFLLSNY